MDKRRRQEELRDQLVGASYAALGFLAIGLLLAFAGPFVFPS